MNFSIANIRLFTIGIDFYHRIYTVIQKSNGLLKFTNALDGSIFLDNVNISIITIDGNPAENIKQIQEVIFNQECFCTEEELNDDFKIFDRTFDKTFE